MHERVTDSEGSRRRLSVDFSAWLEEPRVPPARFFRHGLVVLDANVLLDLYRLTPASRGQVLTALDSVAERLWVPHQAALEFSRHRRRVVVDRVSAFKQARQLLRAANADALEALESALAQLIALRERNATTRAWSRDDWGLDPESLSSRLSGVMDPALAELDALEAEHDVHPRDLRHADALFAQIDAILDGRIGPHYPTSQLRMLVEEAERFRYPNNIPPGYLDAAKDSGLRAAGDFVLWRQTLDRAGTLPLPERLVIFITSDMKADWWLTDAKGRPQGARPELVQEMRDESDADLLLVSLKDFVSGAAAHLHTAVSDETLDQLENSETVDDASDVPGDDPLEALTGREREVLAMVAEGLTNREIGQRLYISERTVGVHVGHVFDKLQVRTRVQASRVYLGAV